MSSRLDFPTTLLAMQQMFPSEGAAAAYLRAVRWPEGFACRFCGWNGEPYVFENKPAILRCRKCQRDTSITADTVMHATRTLLQVWFWAAYLVTTQTPGQSAIQFQLQIEKSATPAIDLILRSLFVQKKGSDLLISPSELRRSMKTE